MQPRDTVDFVEILPAQQIFTFASVFSLRPDRGYLWLQRICFRILRAIGAFHQTESVTYQRTVVSRRATMDAILRMKDVLAQLGNGGETLLVGPEEFKQITNSTPPQIRPFAFDLEYLRHAPPAPDGTPRRPTVLGMRICIIPWMKGMIVVPRDAGI